MTGPGTAEALVTWRACPIDPDATDAAVAGLTDRDRARAAAISHPAARARFVAGRALLAAILSEQARGRTSHGEIAVERSGRLQVVGAEGLHVSLSHTHGLAVAAVSTRAEIGIDVEPLARAELPTPAAWLAPAELRHVRSLAAERRRATLLRLWVAKEAAIKACARFAAVTRRNIEVSWHEERADTCAGAQSTSAATVAPTETGAPSVRIAGGQARIHLDADIPGSATTRTAITWYEVAGPFLVAIATHPPRGSPPTSSARAPQSHRSAVPARENPRGWIAPRTPPLPSSSPCRWDTDAALRP